MDTILFFSGFAIIPYNPDIFLFCVCPWQTPVASSGRRLNALFSFWDFRKDPSSYGHLLAFLIENLPFSMSSQFLSFLIEGSLKVLKLDQAY